MPIKLGTISKTIPYSKAYLGNILKFQKTSAIEFTSCIFPTIWTPVSQPEKFKATNTHGNWNIIAYGCATSTRYVKNAFDNKESTYWQGDTLSDTSVSGEISIECDAIKINPKEIYIYYKQIGNSSYKGQVQGYNTETSSWDTLYTLGTGSGEKKETVNISTENFYSKFRILCYRYSGSSKTPYLYEFKITKGSYMTI